MADRTDANETALSDAWPQGPVHHVSDPVCAKSSLNHWHFVSDGFNCVNVSQKICRGCLRNEFYMQIDVSLQSTLLLVSIVGNCIVLLFMSRHIRTRTIGRSELFITNVCIADLLVTVGCILTSVVEKLTFFFYGPTWLCKFVRYLQVVSFVASTFSIVTMAIDRYIAIVHPMTMYSSSSKIVCLLIIVPWLAALIFSIPQLIFFDIDVIPECSLRGCYEMYRNFPQWMMQTYISLFFIIVYLVPAIILIFTYTVLSVTIWRAVQLREKGLISRSVSRRPSSRKEKEHCVHPTNSITAQAYGNGGPNNATSTFVNGNGAHVEAQETDRVLPELVRAESFVIRERSMTKVTIRSHTNTRMRYRAVAMTATIVIVFILSWAPYTITQLWLLYDENSAPKGDLVFIIGTTLAYFSSCFNPWIFFAFNVRRVCLAILRRVAWRGNTGSLFN